MAETKVTIMVLKVDLDCTKCYKKVKKLLCKYPQIRDQVYTEKANTVTITVVCCSPEKIRDKLCCKGRGTIKSIDIKEPEKKKPEPEKKKEPEKKAEPEKKKEPEKKAEPEKKKEPEKKAEPEKSKSEPEKSKPVEKPAPKPPAFEQVPIGYPYPAHGAACCGECYEGRPGGPCFSGYGMPMPPPPCNCGCGGGRSVCYNNGYTVIYSEDNQAGCTVM